MDSAVTVHYNAWAVAPSDTRELEQERFASAIMAHLDHLYRSAFFLVRNQDEAQDCVQETCVRALTARTQFTPGTNLKAWLTRILYNFFFDAYGRNKRTVATDDVLDMAEHKKDFWDTLSSDNPGPEKRVLQLELAGKISEALKKIPDEFRAPVVLVDIGRFYLPGSSRDSRLPDRYRSLALVARPPAAAETFERLSRQGRERAISYAL